MTDPDVVIIGAGADGPACASRLARKHGLDVLILEAGPWHGNKEWPNPHVEVGGSESSDPDDLDGKLLDEQYSAREADANDPTAGYLRVGPADHSRAPWFRDLHQNAFLWQISAVGGTSIHYFANHPRAYPYAVDEQPHWPIDYEDLVPYYKLNEQVTHVQQAPATAKEQLFFEGAKRAGYDLLDNLNVTETGYRPQPNAIACPPEYLDADYDGSFSYDDGFRGDSLVGNHFQGGPTPKDAPVREKARKSSNVSWVPRALDVNNDPNLGNVAIRPNTFVTNINATEGWGAMEATGVEFRDTWAGKTGTISADVVVLAAGCIESPRLWLNSDLPNDGWVGKGLTTHWFDWIVGVYPEETLEEITGVSTIDPFVGQNSAARFDKPGIGGMEDIGMSPGLVSFGNFLFSQAGYSFDTEVDPDEPWDGRGYVVGKELKRKMADYRRTKSILILTDDLPRQNNGVELDDTFSDEHGPVPKVKWTPHPDDDAKRDELSRIAARIHKEAGAEYVHRCDWPPLLLHMQSSMGMGRVLDENAEAYNVDRLFIADHSALANGLGGPNPTNSGQALALRTADRISELYF
ncbi:GMC family oxidoreductase N-terminal domain-containing protein [Halocatena marina]|nr:GMC family oxidoreductase N-terminal domain-containing protein [Halocatena marina]